MTCIIDSCAIVECGLHGAPFISPAQRRLFQKEIVLAKELRKPLVMHLRDGQGDSMSAVMWKVVTMLKQNIHRQQKINLHCYTGDLAIYSSWLGMFSNGVFGINAKMTRLTRYANLARQMDLGRLVLETDDVIGHASPILHFALRTRAVLCYVRMRAPSCDVEVRHVNKCTCQYSEAVKYQKPCQPCIYRSYKVKVLNSKNRAHHVFVLLFRGN